MKRGDVVDGGRLKGCVSLGQIISSGLSGADMSRSKLTFLAYL